MDLQEWVEQYSYYIIFILTALIYKLGFARKLPFLKSLIIYIFIALGSILLKVFHALGLPMISALSVAAAMLIIYRVVRLFHREETDQEV
ncbi:MAG: YlaH-like family protein [Bacillaceae bacterium]|nr:YlaH-like family protein [Bacillaceae bacterium]